MTTMTMMVMMMVRRITIAVLATSLAMGATTGATPIKVNALVAEKIATMPSTTLSNGAMNPFFPCGATKSSIEACPYRCWDNSNPGEPVLIDKCYDATDASQAIANSSAICVACEMPLAYEIPQNAADNNTCQPVAAYLNSTSEMIPSRCGTPQKPVLACNWSCAEEQVPFSICAATNQTSASEVCTKCNKMCSTPVLVFDPPQVPQNFSLSTGSCNSTNSVKAACPFRCTDDGDSDNAYCSFSDRSVNNPFTSCQTC